MIVFVIAFLLDLISGDPPEKVDRYYPIVWISRLMYFFDRRTARGNPLKERVLGIIYTVMILILFSVPCFMITLIPSEIVRIIVEAFVLKMTFTVKGIERFATAVLHAESDEEKRKAVQKIVSRDVSSLDNAHLNSATIESTAENLTDSVVAPILYFMAFSTLGVGVFGAMVYRVINTLDAVVGYKTERYKNLGWFAAKTDDLLNFIPEHISAALIILSGRLLRTLSHSATPSHSASRNHAVPSHSSCGSTSHMTTEQLAPPTISAMSRVLCVKLEKKGHYIVGCKYKMPADFHIKEAVKIVKTASLVFAAMSVCSVLPFLALKFYI